MQSGLEAKFSDLEEGLDARLRRIWISRPVNLQALALDVEAVGDPHVQFGKFNGALEASCESLDNPGAEYGLGVRDREAYADGDDDENDGQDSESPAPDLGTASPGPETGAMRLSRNWAGC